MPLQPGQLMPGEAEAIAEVKRLGSIYGYGNLIDHLKQAWRDMLKERYGLNHWDASIAADLGSAPEAPSEEG